jgi:ABC-type phosphate transport system substrate-binding protein
MIERNFASRRLVFSLVLGLAVLGLTGCGGGVDDSPPPPSSPDQAFQDQQKYQEIQAKEAEVGKTVAKGKAR